MPVAMLIAAGASTPQSTTNCNGQDSSPRAGQDTGLSQAQRHRRGRGGRHTEEEEEERKNARAARVLSRSTTTQAQAQATYLALARSHVLASLGADGASGEGVDWQKRGACGRPYAVGWMGRSGGEDTGNQSKMTKQV